MTWNGKKSEFEFFAQNEVRICLDSYHSAWNLLRSTRNVWERVNYSEHINIHRDRVSRHGCVVCKTKCGHGGNWWTGRGHSCWVGCTCLNGTAVGRCEGLIGRPVLINRPCGRIPGFHVIVRWPTRGHGGYCILDLWVEASSELEDSYFGVRVPSFCNEVSEFIYVIIQSLGLLVVSCRL